jgi:hypothetical protein
MDGEQTQPTTAQLIKVKEDLDAEGMGAKIVTDIKRKGFSLVHENVFKAAGLPPTQATERTTMFYRALTLGAETDELSFIKEPFGMYRIIVMREYEQKNWNRCDNCNRAINPMYQRQYVCNACVPGIN